MRLATWNVNSLVARLPRVTAWLQEHQPDVLCMQETKLADDKFPSDAFADLPVGDDVVVDADGVDGFIRLLRRAAERDGRACNREEVELVGLEPTTS